MTTVSISPSFTFSRRAASVSAGRWLACGSDMHGIRVRCQLTAQSGWLQRLIRAPDVLRPDVHVFQLRVPLHRRHPQVAAEAGLLEAAEGGFDVDGGVGVDAEHAGFNPPRDAQRSADVARPQRAAQPVRRVVHLAEHLLLIVERADAYDRAEDFLSPDTVGWFAVQDDRRRDVVPALADANPAGGEAALLARRGREEVFDRLALLIGHERADLRSLVGRIADDDRFRRC